MRGIVVPPPVNAHTHLGDAVSVREPPAVPIAELVRPPQGYKFRLLAESPRSAKLRAMRAALQRMVRDGVSAVVDFREEGAPGVALWNDAVRGLPLRSMVLGRPVQRPIVPSELAAILHGADGIGLSSALEEGLDTRRRVAEACRHAKKRYALHASEAIREDPAEYLDPRPDLLVHLARARSEDLAQVRDAGISVAVCPRSNALFGRQPDLAAMERLGLSVLLGTDNAMFHSPSIWRELEFAYVSSRLRRRPVSAEFLARAALVEPWRWWGLPEAARISPEAPVRPLVLRLPPDDPAYQVVTRTTQHFMFRPGTPAGRTAQDP